MNKQGILWIILSIAMLVIVVLLGGLWLLNSKVPGGAATEAAAQAPASELGPESTITFDPFEYTFKGSPLPGITPAEEQKTDAYYQRDSRSIGDHEVMTFDQERSIDTTRTAPAATPRPVTRTGTQTASTTRTTTQPPRTTTPTAPTRAYYIQTGAFKHQSNAENNNAALTENGMTGRIIKETVRGEQYFSVLIGPYTSKSEAEKFLGWIKDIKGMENSYITFKQ